VWKRGCFGWEYKGKKKSLDEAYRQLLRYREALLNPPLLVVCDFDRYIIRTNFNDTVQETYEFTNDQIDRPENLRVLHALFEHPDYLKPQRTTNEVTKALAEKFAQVAQSLQKRESAELADAHTRAEVTVAQRKNLRIARFLNRLVFCFFAEDTGLLPKNLFSDIAKIALDDPLQFSQALESLFRTMAKGGMFGQHKIRHFNGHLFEDTTVFELNDDERRTLAEAAEADWQFVEPSIMGTLFARGLDPDQSAALGAQYTDRGDIVTVVEPVLMAPLRREWAALKASLLPAFKRGAGTAADRARIAAFLKKLRSIIVMDPACGSGNFLYVSLQMLLGLEKEVITFGAQLGFQFRPEVGVHQLRAIEINPLRLRTRPSHCSNRLPAMAPRQRLPPRPRARPPGPRRLPQRGCASRAPLPQQAQVAQGSPSWRTRPRLRPQVLQRTRVARVPHRREQPAVPWWQAASARAWRPLR
jgi:hypothetical protein